MKLLLSPCFNPMGSYMYHLSEQGKGCNSKVIQSCLCLSLLWMFLVLSFSVLSGRVSVFLPFPSLIFILIFIFLCFFPYFVFPSLRSYPSLVFPRVYLLVLIVCNPFRFTVFLGLFLFPFIPSCVLDFFYGWQILF